MITSEDGEITAMPTDLYAPPAGAVGIAVQKETRGQRSTVIIEIGSLILGFPGMGEKARWNRHADLAGILRVSIENQCLVLGEVI
ncbi:hypothetical protein PC116_g32119 [Phytophthora cactorum]|nr:hypothetical protein PC116_g32119 [Phytophthora cactorum]